MNLREAQDGKEYIISRIETDDEELNAFLFSLGCYSGEAITVVRHLKGGLVVAIKDGRYNIDNQLAEAMHCDHCKNRVEEIVNDMPGIAGTVDLKKGELVVSYAEDVDDAMIKARIERAGYTVTESKDK